MGVICPAEQPLLALVSLMAPVIAMGNRLVIVPSWKFPLLATDFYQILDTSDVPAGVINIVTGHPDEFRRCWRSMTMWRPLVRRLREE